MFRMWGRKDDFLREDCTEDLQDMVKNGRINYAVLILAVTTTVALKSRGTKKKGNMRDVY